MTWPAEALPYFKRQETWEGGETAFRGGAGPIGTRHSRYEDPLIDAVGAADTVVIRIQ